MVQEIRSLKKLAIFFQGLALGAEGGGGLVRGTDIVDHKCRQHMHSSCDLL